MYAKTVSIFIVTLAGALTLAPVTHAETIAYAMVVGGRAEHPGGPLFACATSGPQARVSEFFGGGVGLPLEGYSYCNLAGGITDLTGATSSGVAHQEAAADTRTGSFTVAASSKASIGSLSVQASGENNASVYEGIGTAAEAAAFFSDAITFAGTGTRTVLLTFGLDGAAHVTGNSQTLTNLSYQVDGGPVYNSFYGDVRTGVNVARGNGEDPLTGFTAEPGSISGAGLLYFRPITVTLGTPFDLLVGLYAAAYASPNGGTAENDFFSTATLKAINFIDASGNILSDEVQGIGASGYSYDKLGAHMPIVSPVPVPASLALSGTGLGLLGLAKRRRRSKR
jgi:hypothetical protein